MGDGADDAIRLGFLLEGEEDGEDRSGYEEPDMPRVSARDLPSVTCGECGSPMELKDGRYSLFWGCTRYPECRGTHGAHPDGRPLGTPADKATKLARIKAHAAFDPLWKGRGAPMTRTDAYAWLTEEMGRTEQVHIGALKADECALVITLCMQRKFRGGRV